MTEFTFHLNQAKSNQTQIIQDRENTSESEGGRREGREGVGGEGGEKRGGGKEGGGERNGVAEEKE